MLARTLPGTADEYEVEVTIEQKGGAPHFPWFHHHALHLIGECQLLYFVQCCSLV
jgi:hypothetical protein